MTLFTFDTNITTFLIWTQRWFTTSFFLIFSFLSSFLSSCCFKFFIKEIDDFHLPPKINLKNFIANLSGHNKNHFCFEIIYLFFYCFVIIVIYDCYYFIWLQIDEVRINQLYEQAKIQIITEEVDCTEEESITFAALQFQVKVASQNPQGNTSTDEVDDIDSALSELQVNKLS